MSEERRETEERVVDEGASLQVERDNETGDQKVALEKNETVERTERVVKED